jgi:hypothetical protein
MSDPSDVSLLSQESAQALDALTKEVCGLICQRLILQSGIDLCSQWRWQLLLDEAETTSTACLALTSLNPVFDCTILTNSSISIAPHSHSVT